MCRPRVVRPVANLQVCVGRLADQVSRPGRPLQRSVYEDVEVSESQASRYGSIQPWDRFKPG